MFELVILITLSFLHPTLSQTQCPREIGFLPPEESSTGPSSYVYFYNDVEAQGGSSRFIFPNLSVPCYSNIEKVSLH